MDRRGGCCIARYAGGAYDISKVDRIMLRFRPIAPKPASGSVSGGGSCSSESQNCSVASGKRPRRRARVGNKTSTRKRRRSSPEKTNSGGSVNDGEKDSPAIKTLPLLPEAPPPPKRTFPQWLSFENTATVAVASWVKVECVTDTCPYGGIGHTDEERVRSLEADTCPGFVSDGLNRVRWMNAAYRKMVAGGGEVAAWLVVEGGVALPRAAGFTCRVRVVTCGNEKAAKTVPCDVWRMDGGGFAWRLDTAAALSLWIGN